MVLAVETNLQKLLEGTKQYQVPLYQRTYSWKTDQFSRLWEDLVKLAEDRGDRGAAATHFIGSLVLAPTPSIAPTGLQEFLVVDGQQRLTTLTLLLAGIRDHRAETENPSHEERINEKYLINKWEEGQPLKLLPTQADRASYVACLRRTPHAGDGDPIGAAYRFFRARLVELDDPDDDLDIQRLEEAVIAGLSVVCVTAQHGDNVHRIFESLNNTGLRLTQGDLIRNYLFMRMPESGEHVYHSHWLPLQHRLNSQQLELLFWLDLVQRDETAKQSDTYALQQARLDRFESEADIVAEVERFARLGELLELILEPSKEPNADVRASLTRLNAWGTTTVYPILLHLLERRHEGQAINEELVESMQYLESFFVRRVVVGKATANINRILLRAVTELRNESHIVSALRNYLSTGRKYFATDADVRAAVRTVPFYWSGRAPQRKLILQWLEESFANKEPVDVGGLTIEHVMPQTATDDWRAMLADELEPGEDLEATYQSLIHTIGNLTLTGYNSELSNRPFDNKRRQLATSGVKLNQEIAQCPRWGRAEIQARADRLAERIIDLWPGPSPAAEDAATLATWTNLGELLSEIPAGAWTSYGDVATVIGTHPVPLGQRLANFPIVNAHRVLKVDGTVADHFRWLDPERTESAREVLEAEGVSFTEAGRADPSQRLLAEDLALLIGMEIDTPELITADDERGARFFDQVAQAQHPGAAEGLRVVLDAWVHLGGKLDFGASEETSCFFMPPGEGRRPWPFTVYPTGKVEVVFQHMAIRAPFDDVERRHEFRERLNQITGVDLPASKIELRPGFPIDVMRSREACDALVGHLAWFIDVCRDESLETT